MVVSVDIKHVFKYPIHLVVQTHLNKYPTDKDRFVFKVETIERKLDWTKGIDYRRRVAFCENVVPNFMRTINILNEKELILEEEAWLSLDSGQLQIKSRNVTWAKYAKMWEESKFTVASDNPNWTAFEQQGHVDIHSLGPLNYILEIFARKYLHYGAAKALRIMEELLLEKTAQTERDGEKGLDMS